MQDAYQKGITFCLFVVTLSLFQFSFAENMETGDWQRIFGKSHLEDKRVSIHTFITTHQTLDSIQIDSVFQSAFPFAQHTIDSILLAFLQARFFIVKYSSSEYENELFELYYHPYFLAESSIDREEYYMRMLIGQMLGVINVQKGKELLAYMYFSEVREMAKKYDYDHLHYQMQEYVELVSFDFFGHKNRDFHVFKESLAYYKKQNNTRAYYAGLKNLVGLHIKLGQIDSAKYYMSLVPDTENTSLDYLMIHGDFQLLENDLDSAAYYYELALIQCRKQGVNSFYSSILFGQGEILYQMGQLEIATDKLELALAAAMEQHDHTNIANSGELLRKIYRKSKNYKQLVRISDILVKIYKNERRQYLQFAVEGVQNNIELAEKKSELISARILALKKNEQIRQQRMETFLYLAALSSVLLFAIFLIFLNRQKKKRNRELSAKNREIEEQKKAIESSNEYLRNFAQVVSHDFKQPLRQMVSYSQLLIRSIKNPSQQQLDYQDFLSSCGRDMRKMIDDILNFTNLKAEKENMDWVELDGLADKVLLYLKPLIEETNAKIEIQPLPAVLGKETYLFQVFSNIITNGIKYVADGRTPEITIAQADNHANNSSDKTTILISDNGIGIDREQIPLVFKPFHRLANSAHVKGTGLGLATTKIAVEKMGGRIWIESEKDKGTQIYTELFCTK